MDPLTAIGLVANVISLVDFAAELTSKTKHLINSSSGALPRNEEVNSLAERNKELTSGLETAIKHVSNPTKAETALGKLAQRCSVEAAALISDLDKLKVPVRPDGSRSKLKSVQATLKTMHKDGLIQERQRKLEALERQLCTILLCVLRDSQTHEFDSLKQLVRLSGGEPVAAVRDAKDQLKVELQNLQKTIEERFDRVEKILLDAEAERRAKSLIDSLEFAEMLQRETAISERHGETLSWVLHGEFANHPDRSDGDSLVSAGSEEANLHNTDGENGDDDGLNADTQDTDNRDTGSQDAPDSYRSSRLRDWLLVESGIFWVMGNPASGKSTLMKYLYTSELIYELLTTWAKGRRILMAAHYFWVAGSASERSEHGMLRHLCHSFLSSDPRLVQLACPERWTSGRLSAEWSNEQLRKILHNLANIPDYSMCIFVDGLDESENDRCAEIVKSLKSLARHPNVKICLSSRPWTVFRRTLEGLPMLELHDKIWHDIFELVCDRLMETRPQTFGEEVCNDLLFTQIIVHEWRVIENHGIEAKLIRNILEKAAGNFLWAKLVVSTICKRLEHGDDIASIVRYVRESPQGMNDYLESFVFDRIHTTFRIEGYSETAMALKIALVADELQIGFLGWLLFWMLLESSKTRNGMIFDPEFGVSRALPDSSVLDAERIMEDTSAYLNGCCQDLLRFSDHWVGYALHHRVQFVHRSIFDFVSSEEQRHKIDADIPEHFRHGFKAQLCLALSKLGLLHNPAHCFDLLLVLKQALFHAEKAGSSRTFVAAGEHVALHHLEEHQSDESFYECELFHTTRSGFMYPLWRLGARRINERLRDRTIQYIPGAVHILSAMEIEDYRRYPRGAEWDKKFPLYMYRGARIALDLTNSRRDHVAGSKNPYLKGFAPCLHSAWTLVLRNIAMEQEVDLESSGY